MENLLLIIIIIICLTIGRNVKSTLSWVSGIKSKICTIEFIEFCQFVKGCEFCMASRAS
jgi:hypothetical protein